MNGTNVQFRFGHFGSGTPDVRWKYAYVSKLRKQTRVQTTKASMVRGGKLHILYPSKL